MVHIMQRIFVLSMSAIFLLTSCSAPNTSTPLPNTSTPLPSIPTNVQKLTPDQAKTQFAEIANASCTKAMEEGVVEQLISGEGRTLVLVPKEDAYLDYSAAYYEPEDVYELIYETDAFSACAASISFDFADDISVTFDPTNSTFETTQDFGRGIIQHRYSTFEGLISEVEYEDSSGSAQRTVRYGNLNESDLNILRTAVDRFLASMLEF